MKSGHPRHPLCERVISERVGVGLDALWIIFKTDDRDLPEYLAAGRTKEIAYKGPVSREKPKSPNMPKRSMDPRAMTFVPLNV